MDLLEYDACIVAKYSRLPDDGIEEQADWFKVDLQVINELYAEIERWGGHAQRGRDV